MKDNRIIAEFMGMTYGDSNDDSVMIQKTHQGNEVVPIESMQYHCSWDWLIPVIDEIEHTTFETVQSIEDALSTRHLTTTYRAVVKFINEYKNLVS